MIPEHDTIIEAEGLIKRFGFRTVLRKIDLSLRKGNFLALFGPNGAGKTTLIRILCTLMLPTSGRVQVAGIDTRYHREVLRRTIGIISHQTFLYDNLSAFENLKFYGMMYDIKRLNHRVEELLELVGLSEYGSDPVRIFSRGMQQRLSVARSIIHDPTLLFLDEPYTGLDQHGSEDLKQLLRRFREKGKTMIMTSHNIDRGLELCDQVAILKAGKLVYREELSPTVKDRFKTIYQELTEMKRVQRQVHS